MARGAHPLLIRVTHSANAVLFALMTASGLRIHAASAEAGRAALGAPLHLALAWLFAANALVYLAYFFASGTWRERLFLPRRDARHAWHTVLHELRLRRAPPAPAGLYNGMQRLAYTGVLAIAPLLVASGLAMYAPGALAPLTALLGGYAAAHAIHLAVLAALATFLAIHVVQALRHPRTIADITSGGGRPGPDA